MKKNLNRSLLLLAIAAVTFSSACQKGKSKDIVITIKQPDGEAIAKVGNLTLTVEEASKKFLDRQGSFKGAAHLNTDKKRAEFVDNMVIQKAMFLEAIEQGLTNDPEVLDAFEKAAVQKLGRQRFADAQANYKPTEAEMKDYYDKNPLYFKHDEAFKGAYLSVPMGQDPKKAKEIAQKLQMEAAKNVKNSDTREFARLAMKFAQESKGKNQGHFSIEANESGYLAKDPFEGLFGKGSWDSIKAIETLGNVGPLLNNDSAYFVFMKTGVRSALDESFEDAKPKIVKRLAFEKRGQIHEKFLADLKEKYKIQIFQEKLASLSQDAAAPSAGSAQANAAPQEATAPDVHKSEAANQPQ